MIKVEHIETWGFEHAIRGMRNPMNSWAKSDTTVTHDGCRSCKKLLDPSCGGCFNDGGNYIYIGDDDLDLMKRLAEAGHPHRKYLRQIFVSMDITAPLYWWKEFDTYKVGTVANSCSTMHKIHDQEFEIDDFSCEHLLGNENVDGYSGGKFVKCDSREMLQEIINHLNFARNCYLESKDKRFWWQLIQLLPSSYNQKRTVTFNYENVLNMIEYRANHKLDEWCNFVELLKGLPYIKQITNK